MSETIGCGGIRFDRHGDVHMRTIAKILFDRKGATAIEYGLIAALIAVAAIGAMSTLGGKLSNSFTNVSNNLNNS